MEEIDMNIMRCQSNPNVSPDITKATDSIKTIMKRLSEETVTMKGIFTDLKKEDLKKLMLVTTLSTKIDTRCRAISNIVFRSLNDSINEVVLQTKLVSKTLPMVVQSIMMDKFSDEAGNLQWSAFLSVVNETAQGMNASVSASPRDEKMD
jgi:hypothetical protein